MGKLAHDSGGADSVPLPAPRQDSVTTPRSRISTLPFLSTPLLSFPLQAALWPIHKSLQSPQAEFNRRRRMFKWRKFCGRNRIGVASADKIIRFLLCLPAFRLGKASSAIIPATAVMTYGHLEKCFFG